MIVITSSNVGKSEKLMAASNIGHRQPTHCNTLDFIEPFGESAASGIIFLRRAILLYGVIKAVILIRYFEYDYHIIFIKGSVISKR